MIGMLSVLESLAMVRQTMTCVQQSQRNSVWDLAMLQCSLTA
jgi:hypothetical protein